MLIFLFMIFVQDTVVFLSPEKSKEADKEMLLQTFIEWIWEVFPGLL